MLVVMLNPLAAAKPQLADTLNPLVAAKRPFADVNPLAIRAAIDRFAVCSTSCSTSTSVVVIRLANQLADASQLGVAKLLLLLAVAKLLLAVATRDAATSQFVACSTNCSTSMTAAATWVAALNPLADAKLRLADATSLSRPMATLS